MLHEKELSKTANYLVFKHTSCFLVLGFATQDGDFPIHIAAKWGQVEAVRLLLENGADLCQKDAMGRTVVHWAGANSASTLKDLSNEASFNKAVGVQDESGMSPLALAIREANFESAKILMGTAATTVAGASPLLTVLSGMEYSEALGNCLELVITINPSVVEQVDEKGRCVLHLQLDKMVLMRMLKHSFQNVNLNIQDADGQTPLHLAVTRGATYHAYWRIS
ncbi:ankyrin repeat protein [Oesophagostomum dentatum]|uniref:Ankyrin repeat protein n=1 Tax=Oesophagostomum dentatum TaxID=61180 RepID=A0A0B1TF83_OESDE|nr:ankyrin repeat protein [Oesophagostomum dentatum]